MIAIVDIGNTNIKFAIYRQERFLSSWAISSCTSRTASELYAIIATLAHKSGIDISSLTGAAISSVVPIIDQKVRELFEDFFSIEPVFISSTSAGLFGIRICLAQEIIGADRISDLVAARMLWPNKDLLVIDMGTATVFNLMRSDGAVHGQVIAPGMSCITKSFTAALLPQVCARKLTGVVCNSTVPSVESGIYWGYVSMVEGLIKKILEEENKPLHVVATGGSSHLLQGMEQVHAVDRSLTMKGILQIYLRTTKHAARYATNNKKTTPVES
ncbi:type III pantothenate kinase [Anaplasma platys]|uniref:Type III pantothenate kinase n=1 Tax=Anaplasma platys TaxID=949 RepID=A0A858PYY7_9RICK|nr:type III pantothenate kinase [Anaplasma platys]QJC27780.1 type III pantothenate kinase [Anaplasma platys]